MIARAIGPVILFFLTCGACTGAGDAAGPAALAIGDATMSFTSLDARAFARIDDVVYVCGDGGALSRVSLGDAGFGPEEHIATGSTCACVRIVALPAAKRLVRLCADRAQVIEHATQVDGVKVLADNLWEAPKGGNAHDVTADDTTAWIAAGEAGIVTLDLAGTPKLDKTFDVPGARSVVRSGDVLFVALGADGLEGRSAQDPTKLLGKVDGASWPRRLVRSGGRLLALGGAEGVLEFDAGATSKPAKRVAVPAGFPLGAAIVGGAVVVADVLSLATLADPPSQEAIDGNGDEGLLSLERAPVAPQTQTQLGEVDAFLDVVALSDARVLALSRHRLVRRDVVLSPDAPDLWISSTRRLVLPDLAPGAAHDFGVVVTNSGPKGATLGKASTDAPNLGMPQMPVTVKPKDAELLTLSWSPLDSLPFLGTLTLEPSDPTLPKLSLALRRGHSPGAVGTKPPRMLALDLDGHLTDVLAPNGLVRFLLIFSPL